MSLVTALGSTAAFVADRAGTVASYLYQSRETLAFFRGLIAAVDKAYSDSGAVALVPVALSPMVYTATDRESLHVAGGTISALSFKRGASSLALAVTAGQLIPLNPGDQVSITYSVAPTLNRVPR